MNITYIKLLQAIESFASAHLQIERFGADFPGQMPNFGNQSEGYPILFVSPSATIFDTNSTKFEIEVFCFDIIQKDRANINSILSDTNSILNDLDKWFREGNIYGIDLMDATTAEPLNNRLLDYAAGHSMKLVLDVNSYTICEIPFTNAPVVITEVCDIVYGSYLTCDDLSDCPVIQTIENDIDALRIDVNTISGNTTINSNNISILSGDVSTINTILSGITGTTPSDIVYFDTINPNLSGTTFDPDNQQALDTLYVSENIATPGQTWIWNGSVYTGYTGTTISSTAWNLSQTSIDAGGNKTANIQRAGGVIIGSALVTPFVPADTKLMVANTSGTYLFQAREGSGVWSSGAGVHNGSNTGFGFYALKGQLSATTSTWNAGFGYASLLRLTGGTNNIGVGTYAGAELIGGVRNTIIGSYSSSIGNGATFGSGNTIIGSFITGLSSTLSNSLILADGYGNIKLSGNSTGNLFIPTTPTTDNTQTNLLVRKSNGEIQQRTLTSILSGATDTFVTGGTYTAGTAVFTNNTGGTFNVSGFSTGATAINITYAALSTLVSTSALTKDATYYITDRKIWIDALGVDLLSEYALRTLTIVKDSAYHGTGTLGLWNSTLTPSIGNKVIWGGRLWLNLTGTVGTKVNDTTLSATQWSLIASDSMYFDKVFEIGYEFDIDKVNFTKDNRGNTIYFDDNDGDLSPYCDWGNKYIYGNIATFIANNYGDCYIYDNHGDVLTSKIKENISTLIYGNIFKTNISFNNTDSIYRNVNCFTISSNANTTIYDNVGTDINNNSGGEIFSNTGTEISFNNTGVAGNNVKYIKYNTSNVNSIENNIGWQISGNDNSGSISRNNCYIITSNRSNVVNIWDNTSSDVQYWFCIYNNNNTGSILNNSNTKGVSENSNNGSITENTNNGSIRYNTNNGAITNNSNNASINGNNNGGGITFNSNSSLILDNYNTGAITGNANLGAIRENGNTGPITFNSNGGAIQENNNGGSITYNDIMGNILYNTPNVDSIIKNSGSGDISSNDNTLDISYNNVKDGIYSNTSAIGLISNNDCYSIYNN